MSTIAIVTEERQRRLAWAIAVRRTIMAKKRILSISYDESIMKTRHYIFEQAGFDVVSAWGFNDAMSQCKDGQFDLVVLGHTLPPQDKTALVSALRNRCHCPIVSIRKPGQGKHPDTDFSVDAAEGPEAMLTVIREALDSNMR